MHHRKLFWVLYIVFFSLLFLAFWLSIHHSKGSLLVGYLNTTDLGMHSISCGMKRWYRAAMQVRAAISCLTAATTISRGPWVLLRLHTYTLTGLAIVRQGGPSSFEAPCRESLRLGQAQWNENEIAPGVWGSCSNTCWSSKWERVHLLWNLSELKVSDQKKVGFWEFSDCSPDIYLSFITRKQNHFRARGF